MGGHFWTEIAVWTLFFLCSVLSSEIEFLQDLTLESLPDVSKINVSQDEYTRMMSIYLQRLQDSSQEPDTIPKLMTFNSERTSWRRSKDDVTRLRFRVRRSASDGDGDGVEVENAALRLLAPSGTSKHSMNIKIYQVLSPRRRRLLDEKLIYLSRSAPKWCEFDVTVAMKGWLRGERNLGLDLECSDCINDTLKPLEASLSALVLPESRRRKRSAGKYEEGRRTDCRDTGDNKPKCCRHTMDVNFKKIKEFETIIQPKNYEAGFCKGRCPPNYNHATNHSRIQSLVHKYNRNGIPRTCCAPSKLESLEILRVNPTDPTKLSVERWDNMIVLECACS